ncbi:TPA: alkaline shock response membrane anchor protein AmaP, partial [Streptococcus agalactiae]
EFFGLEKKMNTRVFVKQVEEENVGNAKTNKSRVE